MSDRHMTVPEPDETALEREMERMYAFCFPNAPRTEEEKDAFERAARMQYEHDETQRAQTGGMEMPTGVESLKIGDFQIAADRDAVGGRLTMRSICPAAYGLLLRTGLLYRGAEGRRRGC